MTEAEWLACEDPTPMLEFLGVKASDRKLRLFAVACCRAVKNPGESTEIVAALVCAESYADGRVTVAELESACNIARDASNELYFSFFPSDPRAHYNEHAIAARPEVRVASAVAGVARVLTSEAAWSITRVGDDLLPRDTQLALLRDIFGNPFRPATLDPAWQTSTVVALARGIYEERAFDRMPILADALQDAGCDNEEVLNHCRGGGPHVRGCWVVDLVLGRE